MATEKKSFWEAVVRPALLLVGICLIVVSCFAPYDDTDVEAEKKRSGMKLYTDYGTGCQYLGTPWGGITPRLDDEGTHMCDPLNKVIR